MSNEVTVHNIADTIRTKVKDYIIEAIPKEQFDKLIKTEWDNFFIDRSDNWNKKPSQFAILVQDALKKEIEKNIDAAVQEELKRFKESWSSTGQIVVAEAVKQYAPHFIAGLSEVATAQFLQRERQNRGIY